MKYPLAALALAAALPLAAQAQPARNGNVYDGTAHQPTAGVQSDEKSAGVAPTTQSIQTENHDLGAMSNQLLSKAQHDAKTEPQVGNLYGTQPGGIVEATPATGQGGGSTK